MKDAVDKDAVAVVYVLPEDLMEVVGCTREQAKAWLSDEANLDRIRAAFFHDPSLLGEAISDAYDG
jgi:hypothetical protein